MTACFDTSALIPLIIEEPSSAVCERAWEAARTIVASSLAYVEGHAALAQAQRLGRLTEAQFRIAAASFDDLWDQVTTISPSEPLIRRAAALSAAHGLRGYDAVHCATALAARSDELFAVSGDRALLDAWHEHGIATVDVNRPTGRS